MSPPHAFRSRAPGTSFRAVPTIAGAFRSALQVFDLDQERAAQFAVVSQQFVVSVDFVEYVGLSHNALGAEHLLNLVADRHSIFKQQRQMFTNVDTAESFRPHCLPAKLVSHIFVRDVIDNLIAAEGFHVRESLSSESICRLNPSWRYALARIVIGCMGRTPACCSNCKAASGQSVAQTSASPSFMPSNAFFPIRTDGSNPSTVIACVPS